VHSVPSASFLSCLEGMKKDILQGVKISNLHFEDVRDQDIPVLANNTNQDLFLKGKLSGHGWKDCLNIIQISRNELVAEDSRIKLQAQNTATTIAELKTQIQQLQAELHTAEQHANQVQILVDQLKPDLQQTELLVSAFEPLSNLEESLTDPFFEKIRNPGFDIQSLTHHEVLLFLNLARVPELIPWCEENLCDGCSLDVISESTLCKLNLPLNKRLQFFTELKLLEQGLLGKKEHALECPVCKHQTKESQINFWKEWKLQFLEQFGITPGLLIGLQKDHLESFNLPLKQQMLVWGTVKEIQGAHSLS
jgi:hypothetical protein